jgi:ADP-ribosylglycohydrolase
MSRAMLTGALVGAQVGLEGIPERFIEGLDNGQELLALAKKLGTQA